MAGLDLRSILISVLVLSVSLSLHEYSHARMAFALGDDTAKEQGRLTLNPLAHLDPLGALVFIFARVGWAKPVPVNLNRLTRVENKKLGMLLVSAAGPLSNFVLSFFAAFLLNAWRVLITFLTMREVAFTVVTKDLILLTNLIFIAFFQSNIFLGIFNLLPFPPLDGSKIVAFFLPDKLYRNLAQVERVLSVVLLLVFFLGRPYLTQGMMFLAKPLVNLFNAPWEYIADLVITAMRGGV